MFSNTNAYAVFDLQNNTVSYGGTYTSSTPGSIKSYPNGWKKLTATFTNTASGGGLRLFIMESDNFYGPNTFSTNGESFYAFGFQIEQGVFETSYIPTSGSTYQRVADEASITGSNLSNWYNDLAGAFVVKGKTFATSDRRMFINMDTTGVSGSTGSTIFIENNAVDLRFSQVGHGLKNKISITGGNGEWYGRDIRAAMAYDSTALNVRSNVQPTTYTPETTTTKVYPETLHIGSDSGTSSFFTGHISQIVYYNTTLSSTALEGLTT